MSVTPERLLDAIRAAAPWAGGDLTEAELLARFVGQRDEAAFAALVARHGAMVLGVCRRVLGDAHRAEDVAQAAFLVLAREADKLTQPGGLAAWLHQTARRLALTQRRAEARRQRREASVARPAVAEPADELTVRELLAAFDEELGRLPDRYRLPLILCCLEGCTQEEAAARLGWSAGSVRGRLERGRAALRAALARRGVVLPAALVALSAGSAAKAGFVRGTARVAVSYAAGAGEGGVAAAIADGARRGAGMFSMKMAGSLLLLVGLLTAGIAGVASTEMDPKPATPVAAELVPTGYPLGDGHRWLPQAKSFRLRAEVRDESSPEQLARNLLELKNRFPGLKDPDPTVFTSLLPVHLCSVDCAYDQNRVRLLVTSRTDKKRDLDRFVHLWDGKRGKIHEQYFTTGQNSFRLCPTPERVVQAGSRYVTYLSRQPPGFWWDKTAKAKEEFEDRFGKPTDFVLVGRERYHGVDCHVVLSSVGNQSDRYYVGVKDGRWYGAKEGIIAFPSARQQAYQRAVEEFLGTKLGDDPSDAAWRKIGESLRSLPAGKKAAWCRLLYARVAKDHTPVFEYWFSDFRDVGDGRRLPFREDFLFYGHEGQEKTFVSTRRTLTVKDVVLDRPFEDRLFEEPLTEGATIIDDTHQPPLYYKHKARFTLQEWDAIVKKAAARRDEEAAERRKVEQILGRPAPPLPIGQWLNSKPLTWANLRGKVVVLMFWSAGCAPCFADLSALRGPDDQAKEPGKKDERLPIVLLGVHTAGASKEDVEKAVKKHRLGAPICIDHAGAKKPSWGEFFARCEVRAMPTSIAVDEKGRILAHGTFSEVITAAARHRDKMLEKD